jgi:hypothetical protein
MSTLMPTFLNFGSSDDDVVYKKCDSFVWQRERETYCLMREERRQGKIGVLLWERENLEEKE